MGFLTLFYLIGTIITIYVSMVNFIVVDGSTIVFKDSPIFFLMFLLASFIFPFLFGAKIRQLDNDKKSIYIVTTMKVSNDELINDKYNWKYELRQRTVGFFFNFKNAEDHVLNNTLDIYEDEYNIVVIEKMYPGFYSYGESDTDCWYKFNKEIKKYEKIEKPKCFSSTLGFGMG